MLCHHEIWHFAKVPHESVFYCRFNYFAAIRSLNALTFQTPFFSESENGCIMLCILPCKRGIHWWWWGEGKQSYVTESRKKNQSIERRNVFLLTLFGFWWERWQPGKQRRKYSSASAVTIGKREQRKTLCNLSHCSVCPYPSSTWIL